MYNEIVGDEELLYRRVPSDPNLYSYSDGKVRISSSAFNDPEMQPSVYRAAVLGGDPRLVQTDPTQGVVSLVTAEVRQISTVIQRDRHQKEIYVHRIDVLADPEEGYPAHAIVVAIPNYASKSVFDKTKEALARIATEHGWIISPG